MQNDDSPVDGETGPTNSRAHEWFRLPDAAKLSVRALGRSRLAVTEIRHDGRNFGMTGHRQPVDAFLLTVHLRPYAYEEIWYDGKPVQIRDTRVGDTMLFDLKDSTTALIMVPIHSLQFFLPRSFLNELSDDLGSPRIDQLRITRGKVTSDPVLRRFANSVRPALAAPLQSNELFASHAMLAFGIYVCATNGVLQTPRLHAGGLSAWQERTAKALIDAHIDGNIALQHIAATCGLSTTHFAHAFKRSMGVPPHRWLLQRRVDRAKTMLRPNGGSLSDVALACGFADQSHFTRVFSKATGLTPGRWMRTLH